MQRFLIFSIALLLLMPAPIVLACDLTPTHEVRLAEGFLPDCFSIRGLTNVGYGAMLVRNRCEDAVIVTAEGCLHCTREFTILPEQELEVVVDLRESSENHQVRYFYMAETMAFFGEFLLDVRWFEPDPLCEDGWSDADPDEVEPIECSTTGGSTLAPALFLWMAAFVRLRRRSRGHRRPVAT